MMPAHLPWRAPALAPPLLFLALQGCASPMTSTPNAYPPPGHYPPSQNRSADGALRFWSHNLGVYCFSTWGCRATYGDRVVWNSPDEEWNRPAAEYPAGLLERMRGTQGAFRNFEGPLVLEWRDSRRTPRRAELDLATIFADGLIRHRTHRDDIRPDASLGNPDIVIAIDDAVVRVYMRAFIPLRSPRDPTNPRSTFIDENVLVLERRAAGGEP